MKKIHYFSSYKMFIILLLVSCSIPKKENGQQLGHNPFYNIKEEEVKNYLDSNKNSLDPIEGIYTERRIQLLYGTEVGNAEFGSRIAIINNHEFLLFDRSKCDFFAVVLNTDYIDIKPGNVVGSFKKTGHRGWYEGIWEAYSELRRLDFNLSNDNNLLFSSSFVVPVNVFSSINKAIKLIRLYPLFEENLYPNQFDKQNKLVKSTGSGFLISSSGLIVTNYHVVKEGSIYEVVFPKTRISKKAKIRLKDIQNDIALLEVESFSLSEITPNDVPFSFAENSNVKVGQEVFTLGFPLGDIMGTTPRLATGTINSLYGLQDDPRLFQINNPIQPGNSGGALFNRKGELVGICVSSLSAKYFYENAGIIPQNVNFAIKGSYLKNLIGMLDESNEILNRSNTMKQSSLEDQVEQLNPYIVQVRVY